MTQFKSIFPASFVGFERLFDELDRIQEPQTYPPHNLINIGDDKYLIELAVAGFSEEEVTIEYKNGYVVVVGEHKEEDERNYAHRGISRRKFNRQFKLADHVEVVGASLNNGILTIALERMIPEELKPRTIPVQTGEPGLLLEA